MNLKRAILTIFLAMVLSAALLAQPTGSIKGTVLDQSGAAIPKATVTATGPNNDVKVAETDNNGVFTIGGLVPGKYTVRIIATGFSLLEKTDIDLPTGRALTFDAKLTIEASKQEVTVADTQQVELDPAKNAGALVLKEADLDMLSDDPDDLQADLLALAGPAAGPSGGQIFIDGFSGGQLPPKESIREIRINSNPFSSEFDTQGHGRIEIFTKPGTDKYHGSVNLVYRDWLLNAVNPYFRASTLASFNSPIPASDTKNLMANFSGPLGKKASYFIDFNRRQQREASLINAQVLDPLTFSPVTQAFGLIAPNTMTSISPRIDYQLTPSITLQARYTWSQRDSVSVGGGTSLPSTGNHGSSNTQVLQLTETWVANAKTINETRFQFHRSRSNLTGVDPNVNISVADAFTDGSSYTNTYTNTNNYEMQNYTSITHGTQFLKFGARIRGTTEASFSPSDFLGQFNFTSLASYAIMQQGLAQHLPLATIIANGGGPNQFTIAGGNPLINLGQVDAGLFFQDDWRLRPSMTLSLGLRYEVQNNIGDHGDWAPRVGFAWGIGPGQGRLRQPKMVLRAGAGYFYDRFSIGNVLNSERFNGVNQTTYTVTNPAFFPAAGVPIPALSQLPVQSSATLHIDPNLKVPQLLQSAIGIDRQLPKNITMSIMYLNTRGIHQLRNVNINTPLPGTYVPATFTSPAQGVYPLGTAGIYDLYEGGGIFKQNQLIINMNARVNSRVTLFGYYAYGHANSNVNGAPSNPYNFAADYGRASYDIRHRVNINGSLLLPFGIRVSPNIGVNSAAPFNITSGVDQFGSSVTNSPALAPAGFAAPACNSQLARSLTTCLAATSLGNFVINPPAGMPSIPANFGEGFGRLDINARVSRTWGFGEKITSNNQRQRGGPDGQRGPGFGQAAGGAGGRGGGGDHGGGPGGGRGGPGGGGMGGGMGGGDTSGKKYTMTVGIFFHNLINTVNPGAPTGNLLSPRFDQSTGLGGGGFGGFGGGGGTQAFNRQIDLSLRFSF